MKRVKIFSAIADFEAFVNRGDIDIITVDAKGCEQSYSFQESFIGTVYYDDELANEVNQGTEPALPIQNISVSALNPYAIFDLVHDAHNPTHFETLWNKFLAER